MVADRWLQAQRAEKDFWHEVLTKSYHGIDVIRSERLKSFYLWELVIEYGFDLAYFDGKTVVEVGCGPYGFVSVIKTKIKVGLDPLMDYFKREYRPSTKEASYMKSMGESLPLSDMCADIVFCRNVLNHVSDPTKVVKEMNRILKPAGSLVFQMDTYDFFTTYMKKRREMKRLTYDVHHPHSFTTKGILKLMKSYGFEIIRGTEKYPLKSRQYIESENPLKKIIKMTLPFQIGTRDVKIVFEKK